MRRFVVFLDKNVPSVSPSYCLVELPAGTADEECDETCRDVLDTMIGNEIHTGWDELAPGEEAPKGAAKV